jgi:mercuric ion transport protein
MSNQYIPKPLTKGRLAASIVRWLRILFLIGICFFIICLLIQVFMVGMAVFISPSWWAMHVLFAHAIGFLGLVLLVVALLGRLPKSILGLAGLIVFLISMQYNTIHLSHIPNWSLGAAFHPVSAFLLFWVATVTAWKTWYIVTSPTHAVQNKSNPIKDERAIALENRNETA